MRIRTYRRSDTSTRSIPWAARSVNSGLSSFGGAAAYASTTAQARSARNPIGRSDPAHPRARHDRDAALLDDRFHLRARLALDLGSGLTAIEAVDEIVKAIPGDAKNRALDRQALRDVGEAAGIEAVIESLNWGDYEILMNKFYERIEWIGELVAKEERLAGIKTVFADAHLIRHSNNIALRAAIAKEGFAAMYSRFSKIRDTLSG